MWIESEHMLTVPEPTPEQCARYARNYRRFAICWLVFGVLNLVLGLKSALSHRDELWYTLFLLAYGVGLLVMSWIHYKRAKKYTLA